MRLDGAQSGRGTHADNDDQPNGRRPASNARTRPSSRQLRVPQPQHPAESARRA
jgi:hypothetical protein